jgi:CMP-N-acetylneuraminic acid synthetase
MRNLFIPIKGNSQRVPRKNFRFLGTEPLYKFQLLKFSNYTIFVDTDSEEIYQEINFDKRLKHVIVYKRPLELIGDEISVNKLIKNCILQKEIKKGLCQIHVTNPFLKKETLDQAFNFFEKRICDSVVSCNLFQNRLWRKESYGYCPINHNPMKLEQTQDLPVYYEENSAFYLFQVEHFLKTGNRIGLNPYFYEMSYPENMDIDNEDDWLMVKTIYEHEN